MNIGPCEDVDAFIKHEEKNPPPSPKKKPGKSKIDKQRERLEAAISKMTSYTDILEKELYEVDEPPKMFSPEIKQESDVKREINVAKKELKIIFIIPFFFAVSSMPYFKEQIESIVKELDGCDYHTL